jgi:hypothetical protein
MFKSFKLSLNQSLQIALFLIVGVFVLAKGGHYMPDSYAFLDMRFNRSPFYCTFLKIFTSVFGDNFEAPVILFQYAFIVFAVRKFIINLSKTFNLNTFSQLILQGILLAP